MNRQELQRIADLRVADADTLLAASRYEGAYYLLGYAVECALKACIAKQIREFDFPDRKLVLDSYVHDLSKLLNISGVKALHDEEMGTNRAFATNWSLVKEWKEESRYKTSVPEAVANDFYSAVTDPNSGVLPWLKKHW
ncbi:MAG: HEPN domain-containing protein [Thermoanaerobaculia bacterium]